MSVFKRGGVYWYEFCFGRARVRESSKSTSKTLARNAQRKRRRGLSPPLRLSFRMSASAMVPADTSHAVLIGRVENLIWTVRGEDAGREIESERCGCWGRGILRNEMEREIKRLITKISEGRSLERVEAEREMEMLLRGEMGEEEIGSLLVGLREKGETVGELVGFALAMRRNARDVFAGFAERPLALVDTCGTGGDRVGTFNVSTAAALVAAGAGAKVAKHGNRSISSKCGSADVMEALGMNVEKATERAAECISEAGIAFVYAPAAHAATRRASGARKKVGGRTVFNLLGPLTNPADPTAHVAGVFDAYYLEVMAQALGELGAERAIVVHSAGGMDEIALEGETFVAEWKDGAVRRYTISARDFGLEEAGAEELLGGDAAGNAEIIRGVMRGERGARRDFVVAGAAAALCAVGMAEGFFKAARMAEEAIDSGAAAQALKRLVALTRE